MVDGRAARGAPPPNGDTVAPAAVGIDLGGTKIGAGLVAADGTLLTRARRETPAEDGDAIMAEIVDLARALSRGDGPGGVPLGVGAAGMVNADGAVVYAPNLALRRRAVRQQLSDELGVPVIVANDANVAAWGEFRAGAARDVDGSIVMLTLGTGVGGGLVVHDRLSLGTHGMGAEFGHIIVREGGAQCPCGNRGCLEAYASGTAIGRDAQQRRDAGKVPRSSALYDTQVCTGKSVTIAARAGDEVAIDVLASGGFWLGVGIASLVNAFDPAVVVIGGGAMQAGELLLGPARLASRERVLGHADREEVPIIPALLGDDAGVIGAALLALDESPAERVM